ncbi:hypothetical protein DRO69_13055 [Candidatus Bathyarchaeota archaeon]|nr:MAG: hypothetical protein DRO69_13055 [Candidatus Bathyarchaeota archaeon]
MVNEEKIIEKLDELIFWIKISVMPNIRKEIMENLRDEIEKIVYELSDGKRSSRDIARIVSNRGSRRITHVTVLNMWKKWSILNLVIPAQRKGRYKKITSLKALGIELPPVEELSETGEGV